MLFTRIEDGYDVLVLQAPRCLGLTEKTLAGINQFITRKLLAQGHGFDGDNTANFGVFTQVHNTHGTLAQLFIHLVTAQHGLFYSSAIKQYGSAGMATSTSQHHGL